MDVRGWKNILLQFITECGFTQRIYFNIEQSDINEFFQNFCEHHHKTKNKQQSMKLVEFLKENYPKFEPNLDDANAVVATDFIYVYSLLLHFCCVKYPDSYFHEKCQSLSDQSQNLIASFFKHMLQCVDVERNFLRQAIEEIMQANPRSNESSTSSTNSNITGSISLDSPTKTPQRTSTSLRISPNTPKTFLLEERTRELYQLRALVETERYEKGVLEVQIKQMEEKMSRMSSDHKNLLLHIQELKNDILRRSSEGSEGGSPERNADEESKRRLCKEISQKEEEISKLTDLLGNLKEEKLIAKEKLGFAEKKIVICVDRMNELENKVFEMGKDLEEKNKEIKYLTETKNELERHVAETRKACAANRSDLNSTAECMDNSFSRDTNSSGSICCPENLGRYGVDIQLREMESENNRLREELSKLINTNGSLARHIDQVAIRHSEDFDVDMEIDQDLDDEELANDATRRFVLFTQSLEIASNNYKNQQSAIKQLSEENYLIQEENANLNRKVQEIETSLKVLKSNLQKSEELKMEIENEKFDFKQQLLTCQIELQKVHSEKSELASKINRQKEEFANESRMFEKKQTNMSIEISELRLQVQENQRFVEDNERLKEELTALRMNMQEMQSNHSRKTEEFVAEITSFSEKLASQQSELQASQLAEHTVKENYEQLLIQYEIMKTEKRSTDNYLQNMRTEMSKKELEMTKLGLELAELCLKKTELEARVEGLTQEIHDNKQINTMLINSKEGRIKEIESELNTTDTLLERTKRELLAAETKFDNITAHIKEILVKLEDISTFLQVPFLEDDLDGSIQNIIAKIKELVETKMEATHKIECLELAQLDSSKQIKSMQEKLQNYLIEREEQSKDYKELKTQLKKTIDEYEGQIETLNSEKQHLKEMLEGIPERCSDCTSGQYKMRILEKEREISNVLDEYNVLKSILLSSEENFVHLMNESSHMELSLSEKLKFLTEKFEDLCDENQQLKSDNGTYKLNQTNMEKQLKEVEVNLLRALDQLQEEKSVKNDINEDLFSTKQALGIAEEKISKLAEKLEIAQGKLSVLDSLKKQISDDKMCINDLTAKLSKVNEEKMRMNAEIHKLTLNVDSKMSEQDELLKTLEVLSTQLQHDASEYQRQTNELKQKSDALGQELGAAKEKNSALEKLKAAKECELEVMKEEIHKERADWHIKLSVLIHEKAVELERIENSVLEICSGLANITNIPAEAKNQSAQNGFSSENTPDCCKLNELKNALNGMINSFEDLNQQNIQLKAELNEALANYENLKRTEENIQAAHCGLQTKLANQEALSRAEIKSLETRLLNRLSRVEEDRQHLESVNEKLTHENRNLFRKIANLEEMVHNSIDKEKYQNKLQEATRLRDTVSSQNLELEKNREELKARNAHLNFKDKLLQEALARAEIAEAQLSEARSALQETNEQYKAQKNWIDSVTNDHSQKSDALQTLEQELVDVKNRYSQLETKVKIETENAMHNYEWLQQTYKNEKQQHEAQLDAKQQVIENLNVLLSESKAQITKLKFEKEKVRLNAETLHDKLDRQYARFAEAELKRSELVNENETLKEELLKADVLLKENKSLKEELFKADELMKKYKTLKEKLLKADELRSRLMKENDTLKEELLKTDVLMKENEAVKEELRSLLMEEKETLKKELLKADELTAENKSSKEELRKGDKLRSQLMKENESLKKELLKVDELRKENKSLKEEVLKADELRSRLMKENDTLKEELLKTDVLMKENEAVKEELRSLLMEEKETLKKELLKADELTAENKSSKEELRKGDKLRSQLMKENESLKKELLKVDELRKENKSLKEEVLKADELRSRLMKENEILKAELLKADELTAENKSSKEELRKSDKLRSQLMKENESLKKELLKVDELTKENKSMKEELVKADELMKVNEALIQDLRSRLVKENESLKKELLRADELTAQNKSSKEELSKGDKFRSQLMKENESLKKQLLRADELMKETESLKDELLKADGLMKENESLKEDLFKAENNTQKIQAQLVQREVEYKKIIVENETLQESLNKVTKHFEKQVLEHERENKKLVKELENYEIRIGALQRENDELKLEAKTHRDRITIVESALSLNEEKIQTLEKERENIITPQQGLIATEDEVYTKVRKLEKLRDVNEQKLWDLTQSMEAAEKENVRQSLEIGALNTELKAAQDTINSERQRLKDYIQQHEAEREKLKELTQQYDAVQIQLGEYKENAKFSEAQIHELKAEAVESKTKLNQANIDSKELVLKHAQCDESKKMEFHALQESLRVSKVELADAMDQLITLRADAAAANAEIAELRARLCVLETGLDKEQQVTAKLRLDNQILQAKYSEAKHKLEAELQASEERIKENRLELEGKLDKMKNKMKTLYTEETAKMRSKQEREMVMLKSQKDVLEAQNKKYEEHNRKLSSQIVRLNDKVLEHQKENAFLQTKLKHLEDSSSGVFKRPSSIQGSTITSTAAASSNLGSNLTMEDEEGELFNNTYLTDLKNGICAEELQYRNSLVLPHLKCTYAAYDHGMAEDELKDGPNILDDSTSALLSTTSSGAARKKLSGVTHYKRPGPPTPSKHGGRLSLGGSSEPAREVLRETDDSNVPTSSAAKTPTRFGFFSSRFSLGNGKDEPPDVPPSENLHTEMHDVKNSEAGKSVGFIAACTSTPRTSHDRCEQRRLFDDAQSSPCPSGISMVAWVGHVNTPPSTINPVESLSTPQPQERGRCRQRFPRRMPSISGPRASPCSCGGDMVISSDEANVDSSIVHTCDRAIPRKSIKCHPNIRRIARPSLNLRGNIFIKHRSPLRKQTRQQKDTKARRQRFERFNNNRYLDSPQREPPENNNYAEFNHNPSMFGATRVIAAKECFKDSQDEEEYESSISAFVSEIDHLDLTSVSLDGDHVDIENTDSYDLKFGDDCRNSQSVERPNDTATAKQFEQIMAMTESEAPFEVQKGGFDNLNRNASTSSDKLKEENDLRKSNRMPSTSDLAISPAVSMTSLQHSRTIYGNSMVFHRRMPHINCTHVIRKSSIYVRNADGVTSDQLTDGVLVLADQTITLVDFMHMWSRMDLSARAFLVSSIFAIVTAIIAVAVLLF